VQIPFYHNAYYHFTNFIVYDLSLRNNGFKKKDAEKTNFIPTVTPNWGMLTFRRGY